MFNVSVSNAMDEVIAQLNSEVFLTETHPSSAFNFRELDSLIVEELLFNGIDMHPTVGLYDDSQGSFLYCSDPNDEDRLALTPYRYSFQPIGVVSSNQFYILLGFRDADLFLMRNTKIYIYMSLFLIVVIAIMFIISMRTINNQRKLDQMKNEFINNMTHEIKTPISTISLACEMLQDSSISQDDNSRSNFVGIIADENARMRLLVETILQSSKMSNKNFTLTTRTIDVNQIAAHVAQSFRLTVANRGGSIDTQLQAAPPTIEGDELHITNLIYNLVDNGIKYSTDAPRILIATAIENHNFILRVTDHGIGIAKENQKHIFEKFYRVSTGNVHNVKGFGIGLNYVAQVVKLHHGRISLDSELGQGSTFTVAIPVAH